MATHHPPGTLCWFECGSTNAASSKDFYTRLLGWSAQDVPMPGDMGGHYTLFQIDGQDIAGLYELSGPQFEGVPSYWATYVAVADADASEKRARELGANTMAEPMDVPGVGRIGFIQDPTGATLGLFQAGDHPGSAQLGPVAGTFGWSELATRDTQAAKNFYTQLFGWAAKESTGPMAYTEFQVDGCSIAGMIEMTPQHGDVPPHWLPYVLVDDCDAATDQVGELGGNVIVPATSIPDVGRFSVLADPAGAALAIIKLG